ncbi:MAG TPA: response regulator [Thermoanaerobaculia bacterium]|nr:response regulator [Thermoanaerobaculia bacterium]
MNPADEKVSILLVDDQPANLLALESILSDMDQNLVKAESGRSALKALLEKEFAVILLDVQMPDLNGFETASLIRERDKSRDTPIIFLTALSRNETNVFRGYELGAVDYIFKPFHPEVLKAKVGVFVELFRKREAIKKQAQALGRLSRQNELILRAAAEGIIGVDLNGISTFVNPAAAAMVGRHPDDLAGRDIHSIIHPAVPGVATCDVRRCPFFAALHVDRLHDDIEDTFFREDGTSFPVEFRVSPMHDENGRKIGSVITFRDVSEKRAAAQAAENERRYREAEAQNRAKDNFLATLSHELRTPMTSILGWVQFLRGGDYTEDELREALQMIESSAKLQKRLIDDMLDVSRIVLGKFHVDLRPTHLSEVVEAAVSNARPDASERGVRLTSEVDKCEDLVAADATRLQQVIGNILSNAIKFTPAGKRVDLKLQRVDGSMRIAVCDEGEGIEPSFLPFVFDRLRQADNAKRAGLGLGLAIARHIIDLHHGDIEAQSDGIGKGATFIVTLPAIPRDAIVAQTPQRTSDAIA